MTIPAPPPPITIETADPSAAGHIAALHQTLFDSPWDAEAFRTLMAGHGALCLLARQPGSGDVLAGFILCQAAADEAEVLSLAVTRAEQRRGIARELVEAALPHLRLAGATRLYLEVADDNIPARALYQALGFVECARRNNYYRDGRTAPVDAIVLVRGL